MAGSVTVRAGKLHLQKHTRPTAEGVFCNYSHRICMQNRLDRYDFCLKHILEDKDAPYKQCAYISNKTTKRCPNAAPKQDKRDSYCMDHARRLAGLRHRAMRKQRPKETPEKLLDELDLHRPRTNEYGQEHRRPRSTESVASKALEYASSSDSEPESKLVEQAWRGDRDSDVESVDSEQDDPLKHSGVYTAEEVALITRDKLIKLQSLYIDQFKRLQHVLKEKRREYLHNTTAERNAYGGINHGRDDAEQKDKYDELMSMKRYHKRHGTDALLHRQSKERRVAVSEGNNYKAPSYPKCTHQDGNNKCAARTIPLSKYCLQHVLEDGKQILYQPCGYGNNLCEEPVANLFEYGTACSLHIPPIPIDRRLPSKKSPESVKDESEEINVDVVGGASSGQEDTKPALSQLPIISDGQVAGGVSKRREDFKSILPDMKMKSSASIITADTKPTKIESDLIKEEPLDVKQEVTTE